MPPDAAARDLDMRSDPIAAQPGSADTYVSEATRGGGVWGRCRVWDGVWALCGDCVGRVWNVCGRVVSVCWLSSQLG